MANIKSAKKRIRQNERRQVRNRKYIAGARTQVKQVRALIEDGELEKAEDAAREAYSILDKAARKNVIHPRNAARRKGRIMAQLTAAREAAES